MILCTVHLPDKDEAVRNVTLSQPFNMKSAYGTSLPYTNFTIGFKECIDWIFYGTDQLQVTEVIPIPEKEELELNVAIPSPFFPSDHIALVANLKWND
jgi:2',5'-phosphodiesterase